MDISNALDAIETGWKETVKPAIQEGKLASALNDMQNLNLALNSYLRQFAKYHSSIRFVAQSRIIEQQLVQGSVHPETIREFEAYLRQTKLSVSSNNTF